MARKAAKKTATRKKAKTASAKRPRTVAKSAVKKKTAARKTTKPKAAKAVKKVKRAAKVAGAKATKTRAAKTATSKRARTTRAKAAPKRAVKKSVRATAARTRSSATAAKKKSPAAPKAPRKLQSNLSARDKEQFREMLLQKRAEILGDVSTLHSGALNKNRSEAAGDLSSMPIHMADLGTDNYEMEFTLGLIEGERAILTEIDEALERIQNGTYGLCLATGRPIGKARLRAKPWAKYCYEYTLAQEKGQGGRI